MAFSKARPLLPQEFLRDNEHVRRGLLRRQKIETLAAPISIEFEEAAEVDERVPLSGSLVLTRQELPDGLPGEVDARAILAASPSSSLARCKPTGALSYALPAAHECGQPAATIRSLGNLPLKTRKGLADAR
ncbi:hypothetical protein AS026_11005 [Rhizobium altiplani]|uniref:Uncharacterized protein n=1 Tax=Rhizobium altiplani TaxID=1864509 RepID=A0A109JHP3_9HYPH|nr:hypothetical protein AS026_11005 [Rhizobium altiplani]